MKNIQVLFLPVMIMTGLSSFAQISRQPVKSTGEFHADVGFAGEWRYGVTDAVALDNDYAFIGNGAMLEIYKLNTPSAPEKISALMTPDFITDIFIHESVAYIANYYQGVCIVDVSAPSEPKVLKQLKPDDNYTKINCIAVEGNYLYLGASALIIYQIADPANPVFVSNTESFYAKEIAVGNQTVYIADDYEGLQIFDAEVITEPEVVAVIDDYKGISDLALSGDYLIFIERQGMRIFNVNNPSSPMSVSYYPAEYPSGLGTSQGYAWLCLYNSMDIINISDPGSPVFVKNLDAEYVVFTDVVIDGNTLVTEGGYYNYGFFNTENKDNPSLIQRIETIGSTWSSILMDHYLYVGGETNIWIFDMNQLPNPEPVHAFSSNVGTPQEFYLYKKYLVVKGGSSYIQIFDISEKLNPVPVTSNLRELNDVSTINIQGDLMYIGYLYNPGFSIYNISNIENAILLGTYPLTSKTHKMAYHQPYLFLAGDTSGLRIWNVADPSSAFETGSFKNDRSITHVIYEDYAYIANETNGILALDISNLTNPALKESLVEDQYVTDMEIIENKLFSASSWEGITISDLSSPDNPITKLQFLFAQFPNDIHIKDNYLVVSNDNTGVIIYHVDKLLESTGIQTSPWTENHPDVSIYPNPFNNFVNITLSGGKGNSELWFEIMDVTGRTIYKRKLGQVPENGEFRFELDTENWNEGIYFYQVFGGHIKCAGKMVRSDKQ